MWGRTEICRLNRAHRPHDLLLCRLGNSAAHLVALPHDRQFPFRPGVAGGETERNAAAGNRLSTLILYRLAAYVIAGMIAGVAGGLLANAAEFVSPAYMSWHRSGELIFMVVLGGLGSFSGAILGATGYLVLEEVLSHVMENWRLIFGPFLILVVLFGRGGLMGLIGGGKRPGRQG